MIEYLLITFQSANFAMQTEHVLKEKGFKVQVLPTPREITLSCGLSIKTDMENYKDIEDLIKQDKIKVKSLYSFTGLGREKNIKEIAR